MVLWSAQLHNSKSTGCLLASGGEIVANIPVLIQGQVSKRWQEIKIVFEILSNILDNNPSVTINKMAYLNFNDNSVPTFALNVPVV